MNVIYKIDRPPILAACQPIMAQCGKIAFSESVAAQSLWENWDHPTGDFCAGITGRLGCKVIWMIMDDDHPSNHLIDRKTIGQKQGKRKPVIPEQRRQIPCVVRVAALSWIIMRHDIRKWVVHITATVGSLMDMESENPVLAGRIRLGQTLDFSEYNHTLFGLVEPNGACNAGVVFAAYDAG